MQVRLRNVLWSYLAEDLGQGPVTLARRRGECKASPAALREPAIRCPQHGREPDAGVRRCAGDAHPAFRKLKRFGDAALALGAVPDGVLHPGTGMMRDQVSVGTDLVKNLLVRTGHAGTPDPPVTEPPPQAVRSSRQIPFGIVKGITHLNRVVEPAPR